MSIPVLCLLIVDEWDDKTEAAEETYLLTRYEYCLDINRRAEHGTWSGLAASFFYLAEVDADEVVLDRVLLWQWHRNGEESE